MIDLGPMEDPVYPDVARLIESRNQHQKRLGVDTMNTATTEPREVSRIKEFDSGDTQCIRCGKTLHLYFNGGELDGRRYLSAAALKELTSRQTPKDLKESYGLGLNVGPDFFGHGGAHRGFIPGRG